MINRHKLQYMIIPFFYELGDENSLKLFFTLYVYFLLFARNAIYTSLALILNKRTLAHFQSHIAPAQPESPEFVAMQYIVLNQSCTTLFSSVLEYVHILVVVFACGYNVYKDVLTYFVLCCRIDANNIKNMYIYVYFSLIE